MFCPTREEFQRELRKAVKEALEVELPKLYQAPVSESEWMTAREAAGHLKVSRSTLYRRTRSGAITGYKFGGCLRYNKGELDLFIERGQA